MSFRATLICNPENRRAHFFVEAVAEAGGTCEIVSWLDLLRGTARAPATDVVRIESPGENRDVEDALVARGRRLQGLDPVRRSEDVGRIRDLDSSFIGFADALAALPRDAVYLSDPSQIAAMFDKVETKRRFEEAGIDTPGLLGVVRSFDELRGVLAGRERVFVKPRYGSSASGVVALSIRGDRVSAHTSVEMEGDRLYNSLKIRRYGAIDEVSKLVDRLGRETSLLVEEWVPKGSIQGRTFDARIVVIDGCATHSVIRASHHPMTNLHLGNERGDLAAAKLTLGPAWEAMEEAAIRAMRCFPGASYGGVDVASTPSRHRAVVFEANAFGDLLPGVVDAAGRSTYEASVDRILRLRREGGLRPNVPSG